MNNKIVPNWAPNLYVSIFSALLAALPNCVYGVMAGSIRYVICHFLIFYFVWFLVTGFLNCFGQYAKRIFVGMVAILTIRMMINLFCVLKLNCQLTNDLFSIAAGTNKQEIKEFLSVYLHISDLLRGIGLLLLIIIATSFICRLGWVVSRRSFAIAVVIWFGSIAIVARHWNVAWSEYVGIVDRWNFKLEEVVDLRLHLKKPNVIENRTEHPDRIVIILGESYSRSHSSLYGYEYDTNPCLSQHVESGNLIVFDSVMSPAATTTMTFKYLLGSHTLHKEQAGEKWYEGIMLPEVLSKAGYHTVWLSNQCEHGVYDNLPSAYSKICDEYYFSSKEGGYDEQLLQVDIDTLMSKYPKIGVFYHLMGQHESFEYRYPPSYERFHTVDYSKEYTQDKSQILASYDNATYYNDWIVDTVIKHYQNDNSMIIYLSDHSLDLFETSSDYFGHAMPDNPISEEHCKHIPFMVYCSPTLQQKNPELLQQIIDCQHKPFCTDHFYYLLLNWIGYQTLLSDDGL